jgi:hypothetical protein
MRNGFPDHEGFKTYRQAVIVLSETNSLSVNKAKTTRKCTSLITLLSLNGRVLLCKLMSPGFLLRLNQNILRN